MKDVLHKNKHYLYPYLLFLIAGAIVFAAYDKASIHLFLNKFYHPVLDHFFRYITYVGDGIVVMVIVMFYMFIKLRHSILLFLSYALSSIATQVLKNFFFEHQPRPMSFFEGTDHVIRVVPGVEMHHWKSFPSGHSSAAFTMFFCLGLITERPWLKFIYFALSVLVAYSRVYLSQHFLVDIYAGSILGVATAIIIFKWMETASHFRNKEWLDKPIYSFKSRS